MAPRRGTKRELVGWIWYPAQPGQPSQAVNDYFPAPWRTAAEQQWEIMIRGANHYMFSDDAVLKSPLMAHVLRTVGTVGIDGRRQVAVTQHYISTFFDVYLKGAPASELKSQAEYPEVEYVH